MATAVLAWWQAQPGAGDQIATLLHRLRRASLTEPGCHGYEIHRSSEDADRFFLYELYDDRTAYEAHVDSDHFAELAREQGFPLLADRSREFFELISSGTDRA